MNLYLAVTIVYGIWIPVAVILMRKLSRDLLALTNVRLSYQATAEQLEEQIKLCAAIRMMESWTDWCAVLAFPILGWLLHLSLQRGFAEKARLAPLDKFFGIKRLSP